MRNWGKRIAAMVLALCCALLLTGCSSVESVEKKIDAIGNVTLDSQKAIEEAETAYAALKPEDQQKVKNYGTLQSARESFDSQKEWDAQERKDQQDAVPLAEKIITAMGETFKSPLNLTVENIWYMHSLSLLDTNEVWSFTFQITAPNGFGTYLNEYYNITLFETEDTHDLTNIDDALKQEVSFWKVLGHGVLWRQGATTMQYGTQMAETDVKTVQEYYMKHVKAY